MSKAPRLTRGVVSKLTGCNLETIRYYEQIGLMPPPPRSEGGHRLYDDNLLRRLNFIRRCRELGFSLEEVRGLLTLVDGGTYTRGEVKDRTVAHLRSVRSKIVDLKVLEKTLKEMVSKCVGDEVPDCPVIDALFRNDDRALSRSRPRSPIQGS
ncbi:MAG: MerR family transcriptional regulator [Kiloniellaceae bacterium]|nr:MerR family transcriptional regulator [Kiloniellaceae bacterium]